MSEDRCANCGSEETIEELRAKHRDAIACCPERDMQPIKLLDELTRLHARLEEAEAERDRLRLALESRPNSLTDAFDAGYAKGVASVEAQVAVLVEALKRHAIVQHERMAYGGGFVPTGWSCKLCKGEWGLNDPPAHSGACALANLPAQASALIAEREKMRAVVEAAERLTGCEIVSISWANAYDALKDTLRRAKMETRDEH